MRSKPLHKQNRTCHQCGQWYWRVNRIAVWAHQGSTGRVGWFKIIQSICTKCMGQREAQRVLKTADIRFPKSPPRFNLRKGD